jgi:uroporphyrinogen decarboxylase
LNYYLKGSKLNLATAFSPLTLAQKIAGEEILLKTMRNVPELLHSTLTILSDTMIDFINHCVDCGADGLYFATQTASFNLISLEEARMFEDYYNLKVLNAVRSRLQVVILHLHGDHIMIKGFDSYPIDVLNWADKRTVPPVPLSEGGKYFSRVLMGGINGRTTLCTGTRKQIEDEVISTYKSVSKPFIVSPCCVIPISGVPEKNIHFFRNSVNKIIL